MDLLCQYSPTYILQQCNRKRKKQKRGTNITKLKGMKIEHDSKNKKLIRLLIRGTRRLKKLKIIGGNDPKF